MSELPTAAKKFFEEVASRNSTLQLDYKNSLSLTNIGELSCR